jgi:integrase
MVDQDKVMYADQLQYKFAAEVYQDIRTKNSTFNYFVNKWLNEFLSGLEEQTKATYRSKLRIFERWLMRESLDQNDISTFDNKLVLSFFHFLIHNRMLGSVTYNHYKQILFKFFDYVLDQGKIMFNPVQRIPKNTRIINKEPKPINEADMAVLMNRIKMDKQLYLSVLFEYYCLMRPKEIRLMRISWIDFSRNLIFIPASYNKTKRPKTPIVPDVFMDILRNEFQLQLFDRNFYVIGKNGSPGDTPFGKNTMRYRFNAIRKELKMPTDYMLYSWKHTANVMLEEDDFSVFDRMMQNGHNSIVTTEIYTKNRRGFKSDMLRKQYPQLPGND